MLIAINSKPIKKTQALPFFFCLPNLRSRYCAYVSCVFLPNGINVLIVQLKAYPIPRKAPSLLTYKSPKKSTNNAPTEKKASCRSRIFSLASSWKNPPMAQTTSASASPTHKVMTYFHSIVFFSFSTNVPRFFFYYLSCCLYFSSSSVLQYTKCPGETSRIVGCSTE